MGHWLADVAAHDAWALWLAVPALGVVLVCVGVWWWARPARPATTSRSIDGHHAYLEALTTPPRERVTAPAVDGPAPDAEPPAHAVVLDATVLDGPELAAAVDDPATSSTVTVHA